MLNYSNNIEWSLGLKIQVHHEMNGFPFVSQSEPMCLSWSLHLLMDTGERVDGQVTQVDFKPQSENALMKLYCTMLSEVI